MVAGIIACVLAVLGILFLGIVFVPLAALVALFGTIIAVKNRNVGGIGVNVLAWVLVLVGLFTLSALFVKNPAGWRDFFAGHSPPWRKARIWRRSRLSGRRSG